MIKQAVFRTSETPKGNALAASALLKQCIADAAPSVNGRGVRASAKTLGLVKVPHAQSLSWPAGLPTRPLPPTVLAHKPFADSSSHQDDGPVLAENHGSLGHLRFEGMGREGKEGRVIFQTRSVPEMAGGVTCIRLRT